MAGIYIHIPFCKKKCYYCDFYKTTNLKLLEEYLLALEKEIVLKKHYLGEEDVSTIYFGGGTPSVLKGDALKIILDLINKNFKIIPAPEITIEVNPDDINIDLLQKIKMLTSINRLSIGVQSLHNLHLKEMNRRHNADEAIKSLHLVFNKGFNNVGVDLMYGLPNMNIKEWEYTIYKAISFPIKHVSAYHLTIEYGTKFHSLINHHKLQPVDEDISLKQFELLVDIMENNHYIHYEISNFALEGYISKHNSNYWFGQKYLGLGPSAHSFNGEQRHWNVSNINKYIKDLQSGKITYEKEILTKKTKYNEYLLSGLRTMWGVNIDKIKDEFGDDYYVNFNENIKKFIANDMIVIKNNNAVITRKGKFISDYIIRDIMKE